MTGSRPATPQALQRIAELLEQARFGEAEVRAHELCRRFPFDAQTARLRAIALLRLGRIDEALATLQAAQRLAPDSIEVLCNLGSAHLAAGDGEAAIAVLERARALAPRHPAVLNGLGNARRAEGDLAAAREAYRECTQATPDYAGAWLNLAAVELALGEPAAAERAVRLALQRAPGHPEGLLLLGHVLAAQRRHAEAAAAYEAGARTAPRDARFAYQIGLMAEERRQLAVAAEAHARALALDPGLNEALGQLVFLRRQLCDWRDLDALSGALRSRVHGAAAGISPFAFLAEPAAPDEQLRCARTEALRISSATARRRARLDFASPRPAPDAPLRVGFVAAGFGHHPTALLVVAFVEALREHAIDLHLFSTAADDDSPTLHRLRRAAHRWHDASGASADALAHSIHAAGIEIAIDLDGYCDGSRPEAFALRPAPLQVNWLAYPGTMGAPWIDYVVADRVVLPEALCAHFSENVAWLPRCFQPSDPTRVVGEPPSRRDCGLPDRGAVYACFNNSYKINPASFERLLAVLRAVDDSVLWLLSGPEGADARLRAEAQRRGVDPARLVFTPKRPHAEYLALYRHADLFLDTAPYGAHTTASDAIWAGCPVLTAPGPTFASRVAASLNHHLGLPQLNATDDAAFVDLAARLGRDAAARAALRAELAARRDASGLFDMRAFATDFAALLGEMARRHRAGLPPAPIG